MRYFIFFFAILMTILHSEVLAEHSDIKIGVVVPLTGPISNIGTSIMNMIRLASEEPANKKKVSFIFEDDGFQPQRTVSAVRKLISSDSVDGLIMFGSGTSLAAAPIIEQNKIPTISIAIADSVVANHKHMFRLHLPIPRQNDAILNEISKKGYKSLAIVTAQQEAMLQHRDMLLKGVSAPVTFDEQILPGETDMQSIATRIIAKKPDAVYLLLFTPALSNLPQQMRNRGYKGDFFGPAPLQNKSAVKAAQGALDGAWFVSVDDSSAAQVYLDYQKRFDDFAALEMEGLNGYDAAQLFIMGAEKGDILGFLSDPKDFVGALGPYSVVAPNTYDLKVFLKKVSGNSFIVQK